MRIASLVNLSNNSLNGCPYLNVRGSTRAAGTGIHLSPHITDARIFASKHEFDCEVELAKTEYGFHRLAKDNPFLTAAQLAKLDDRGCMPQGALVNEGDVLASVVYVRHALKGEDKVPSGMQRVCSDSLEAPPGSNGSKIDTVEVLSRRDLPRTTSAKIRGKVKVRLVLEREINPGDVLIWGESELGIVSRVDVSLGDGVDIELDALGTRLAGLKAGEVRRLAIGKAETTASEFLHARGIGPYSLISCRPLGGKSRSGGLEVSVSQIRWLRERGMMANVTEFTSLKCDDMSSRKLLRGAYRSNVGFPEAGMPESLRQVEVYLWGMGLYPSLERDGDHVEVTVRVATRDELLARSSGEVWRPETLNYATLKPTPDALFCERIFGPERGARRNRFGHIALAQPIVPFFWRMDTPSVLEELLAPLKFSKADIENVVQCKQRVIRTQSGAFEFADAKNPVTGVGIQDLGIGAVAIRALLEGVDLGVRKGLLGIIQQHVLVIPPDFRPLVQLQSGNWATSDLNELYRIVINRNNRLKKLIELKAPQVILINEQRELQLVCDGLFANSLLSEKTMQLSEGRRLVDISRLLCGHAGNDWQEKRVDFSARSAVVMSERIEERTALIPSRILTKLKAPPGRPLLITAEKASGFVALLPRPCEGDVVSLPPLAFHTLEVQKAIPQAVVIHRPLTEAACGEAEELCRSNVRVVPYNPRPSWLDAGESEILSSLARSVVNAETAHFETPRGLLVGGSGSLRRTEELPPAELVQLESGESCLEEKYKLVPAPSAPGGSTKDAEQEINLAVQSCRRKACIFEPVWTTDPPSPTEGAWGKLPWLPIGFEWPCSDDVRLRFVAQLPLDPAVAAGAAPFDAPPGSLLTIFWSDDWWEQHSATRPIVQLLNIADGLEQFCEQTGRAPEPSQSRRRLTLKPVIHDELPIWSELRDLLHLEFDARLPQAPVRNETCIWGAEPSPGLKLGGWANWIQNVESEEALVVQIPSNDQAGWMFGDSGRLYVMGNPKDGFNVVMQYY